MFLNELRRTLIWRAVRGLYWQGKNIWSKNPVRLSIIAARQMAYMDSVTAGCNQRVIIFLAPGYDIVNGGVMSIISLADETVRLQAEHGADVFVCTLPGTPPLLKYTKFPNNRTIVDFDALLHRYTRPADILIHIPETHTNMFLMMTAERPSLYNHSYHFNVMLQNIDLIPNREDIERLEKIGKVTATTAHIAYANESTERILGCPIHHFSVWISPEKYEQKPFSERENIFVLSPDRHTEREVIVHKLKKDLPGFRFITVKWMTYLEYRKLISSAKFSLTFGEGLDGYYLEIIFAGGIGCTVYNSRFFTKDFEGVPFIYSSWSDLASKLPTDVHLANNPKEFERFNSIPYRLLCEQYSYDKYQRNLSSFYKKIFS